jgi:hypothetical protein
LGERGEGVVEARLVGAVPARLRDRGPTAAPGRPAAGHVQDARCGTAPWPPSTILSQRMRSAARRAAGHLPADGRDRREVYRMPGLSTGTARTAAPPRVGSGNRSETALRGETMSHSGAAGPHRLSPQAALTIRGHIAPAAPDEHRPVTPRARRSPLCSGSRSPCRARVRANLATSRAADSGQRFSPLVAKARRMLAPFRTPCSPGG